MGDGRSETGSPPTPQGAAPRPEDLQSLWNRLAVPKGLMRWEGMSDKRRAAARESLKACPDLGRWEAWLTAEFMNPFNLGQNDSGWRADVDWLLRVKSRDKVKDFDPSARPVRALSAQSTGLSDWEQHRQQYGDVREVSSEDLDKVIREAGR